MKPLDFYLWGYVKSKCFVDKLATIKAFEANITEVISEIQTEVLERVIQNWCLQMDELRWLRRLVSYEVRSTVGARVT